MAKSILYIFLPCKKIYPAGIIYLAGFIHNHLPNSGQRILDLNFIDKKNRKKGVIKNIEEFNPDVIAFSWRDIQTFSPDEREPALETAFRFYYSGISDKIRAAFSGLGAILEYNNKINENLSYIRLAAENYPEKKVIVGGGAFSVFSEQISQKLPDNVVGIIGEGENAILKILKNVPDFDIRNSERSVSGKIFNFNNKDKSNYVKIENELPIDFEYITSIYPEFKNHFNEYIGIQTKRGCSQNCMFCVYNYIEGKDIRCRKPEIVASEIQSLCENWGARKIWFTDAQFIPDKDSILSCEKLLEEIIKRKLEIEWSGYIRVDNVGRNFAGKMVESGISMVELSITSGSQRIINNMNLGFELQDVFRGLNYLKDAEFEKEIILNYSLNAPGETKETLRESMKAYRKISKIFDKKNVRPFIFFLGIQPHTGLEKFAIRTGHLPENYNLMHLNPFTIKQLIYNPKPLDALIANSCIRAWNAKAENFGEFVFWEMEKKLQDGQE